MKEDEKRAICKNWVYLIKNLTAKDLTKYFIAKMILTLDDDEKIRSFSTLNDQNDEFLKTITRKGVNSFGTLIDALRKENDDYTADLLENSLRDERAGNENIVMKPVIFNFYSEASLANLFNKI